MYVAAERRAEELHLELEDHWSITEFARIGISLAALDLSGVRSLSVGTAALDSLDLSGSWLLHRFLERARRSGVAVRFTGEEPPQLKLIQEALARTTPQPLGPTAMVSGEIAEAPTADFSFEEPVRALGKRTILQWREILRGLAFIGHVSSVFLRALLQPLRLRPISIARHVYETGMTAIPIVALIAFLISVIIAYLSAEQLQNFGAEIFVVNLVTIGTLRKLGVLLTAIIVAGRSGSAFAAEIGSMQLNQEVDALKAIGVEPYEVLVVPRVIGLVIALPLLTVIADAIGLTGGALLCKFLLDMPITQYLARANDSIASTTFWVGIVKAPVFAILIALAGTYRGMQVKGSSRELGRLTTMAVVQAIFLVILADALFAVLFMELDI
jgi:phospholipid/cholesterol/gamma-HCH transport system permease protein